LNKPVLYSEDIKKIIPHRYPFLMIDRIENLVDGKSCVAFKNVSNNDWFFTGHFPDYPIMPGVLIIEAMAQAAGVLAFSTLMKEGILQPGESKFVYFTSIEQVKFKRPVFPGDTLKINVALSQRRGNKFWKFTGSGYVGDELADTAEFMAMIPDESH
jgi:3-hydroxyacyl-[acyl-carrier-protein] dehydratase